MAQKKNATFQGTAFYDVEPDSISSQVDHGNLVGDLALLNDIGIGTSGTITHRGDGFGCPLGFPLIKNGHFKYTFGPAQDRQDYVYGAPCFFPPGQTSYQFLVHAVTGYEHFLEVYSFTSTELNSGPHLRESTNPDQVQRMRFESGVNGHVCTFEVDPTSNGKVLFLAVRIEELGAASPSSPTTITYYGFHCFPIQNTTGTGQTNITRQTNSYPVASQSSGGATIKKEFPFEEAVFSEDFPIGGHVLTRVNRQQNAFFEYLTGAPAGDNNTLTLADSSVSQPTTSAFYNHKPGGANGFGIYKNLCTYGTGNFASGWGDVLEFEGSIVPGSLTAGSGSNLLLMDSPQFTADLNIDNGGSTPTKLCVILICTQTHSPASTVTVLTQSYNSAFSSAGTYSNTISVSTPGLYACFVDTPNIHPDVFNVLRIRYTTDTNYTGGKAGTDIPGVGLLGASFYLRPS